MLDAHIDPNLTVHLVLDNGSSHMSKATKKWRPRSRLWRMTSSKNTRATTGRSSTWVNARPFPGVEASQAVLGDVVLALARLDRCDVDPGLVGAAANRRHERIRDRGHHRPRRERQTPMTH